MNITITYSYYLSCCIHILNLFLYYTIRLKIFRNRFLILHIKRCYLLISFNSSLPSQYDVRPKFWAHSNGPCRPQPFSVFYLPFSSQSSTELCAHTPCLTPREPRGTKQRSLSLSSPSLSLFPYSLPYLSTATTMVLAFSPSPPVIFHLHKRISPSLPPNSLSSSSFSPMLGFRLAAAPRRFPYNCSSCSSELRLMADGADEKTRLEIDASHSRTFLHVSSEEELLSGIKKERELGRLPSNVADGMEELYRNYRNAVVQSGIPNIDEIVFSNMSVALDRVLLDVEEPFDFPPYHKAVREPFDYYMFGQNYIRPLVDFQNSFVGNLSLFHEIVEKQRQGHNIVFMSNHQTEADPAVIALLLEKTHPYIAENTIYVAGDRVVTDPLCKPYSMGRNLLCVYSKKHMHDIPELFEKKRRANTRSLKEMALLLRGGSQIIWIAPSGGRDRPDPITKECYPAPFDVPSVDNMRRLIEHAGVPGHIYPLSLLCYDIMPPPPQVEKEIGEKRMVAFHGTGLSVGPEISYENIASHCETEEEAKSVYAEAMYNSVNEQYNILKSAIYRKQGLSASTSSIPFPKANCALLKRAVTTENMDPFEKLGRRKLEFGVLEWAMAEEAGYLEGK
ncbi:hypothetical protein V2J09_014779 [Rumex salicifolius]